MFTSSAKFTLLVANSVSLTASTTVEQRVQMFVYFFLSDRDRNKLVKKDQN